MTKEALRQALEALESATPKYTRQRKDQKTLGGALDYWKLDHHQKMKAITALRQAIKELESQEPVAILNHAHGVHTFRNVNLKGLPDGEYLVFTHPPQRTWVGLTDEEIAEGIKQSWVTEQAFQSAVWWAEKRLKEKNT